MIPVTVTCGPVAAAQATGIALAQSTAGAANLTLNGALVSGDVATMDVARQIAIASVGNDSGITFTVTGTNSDGNGWRETIAGTNGGTAVTTSAFKKVTSIATSGATAGNVTVGTNTVAMSRWVLVSWLEGPCNVAFACVVSGTANYTINVCYTDFNATAANVMGSQALGNYPTPPVPFNHPTMQNLTTNADGAIAFPIVAWRVTLNSGSGSVTVTGIPSGVSEGFLA